MYAQTRAQSAYDSSLATLRSDRTAEYDLIAGITGRMRHAAGKGATGFSSLAKALHDNRRLWTRLGIDVADDGNSLSPELRGRIFYLAEFVIHYTPQVLRQEEPVAPLIEINIAIMRGLNGVTEQTA